MKRRHLALLPLVALLPALPVAAKPKLKVRWTTPICFNDANGNPVDPHMVKCTLTEELPPVGPMFFIRLRYTPLKVRRISKGQYEAVHLEPLTGTVHWSFRETSESNLTYVSGVRRDCDHEGFTLKCPQCSLRLHTP